MSKIDISDLRFSSSSIDEFFVKPASGTAKVASAGKVRLASLQALAGFERVAADTLIHVSQQDFWKLGQDDEGFFIERLVDDSTAPVKG